MTLFDPAKFRIIDISVPLRDNMPIYPGDPEFSIRPEMSLATGDSAEVSIIEMGAHTGTHLDFPSHFLADKNSCKEYETSEFILDALVVETADNGNVRASDLEGIPPDPKRAILFKTENSRKNLFASDDFRKDFVGIGPDAADKLLELQCPLVGIDYLSIDPYGAESYPSHDILLPENIILLEGVDLSEVTPGSYTLICLPLKFEKAEASPVRAVLLHQLS